MSKVPIKGNTSIFPKTTAIKVLASSRAEVVAWAGLPLDETGVVRRWVAMLKLTPTTHIFTGMADCAKVKMPSKIHSNGALSARCSKSTKRPRSGVQAATTKPNMAPTAGGAKALEAIFRRTRAQSLLFLLLPLLATACFVGDDRFCGCMGCSGTVDGGNNAACCACCCDMGGMRKETFPEVCCCTAGGGMSNPARSSRSTCQSSSPSELSSSFSWILSRRFLRAPRGTNGDASVSYPASSNETTDKTLDRKKLLRCCSTTRRGTATTGGPPVVDAKVPNPADPSPVSMLVFSSSWLSSSSS
mmetsp:Transcript_22821/g.47609  ORF Transcript_22821/g.47609 Transcript_22821/m.47609 type:complete len:302 (-) Transcript_22821:344-1249(-)